MADKVLRLLIFKSAVLDAVPIGVKDNPMREAEEYLKQRKIPVEWAFLSAGDWVVKP